MHVFGMASPVVVVAVLDVGSHRASRGIVALGQQAAHELRNKGSAGGQFAHGLRCLLDLSEL